MKTAVTMTKPINKIFAHPKNPRLIRNEKYLEQKKSIEETPEMMDLRPVIIDEDDVILGGHQRWRACKELGWKDVPVMQYTREKHLKSESFTKFNKTYELVCAEIVIKDNTHYGEFDYDILANEWDYLPLTEYGVAVWETEPEEVEGLTDADAVPEAPQEPITKLGDVWILGEHRVMCGDSTSKEAVEVLMDGKKADMVFTDPPYGINEKGDRSKRGGLAKGNNLPSFKDDTIQYAIDAFNQSINKDIKIQVWFGANYYCHSLPQSPNWLVWDKRVEENQRDYNSDCELAWVKSNKKSVRIFRHLWKGMLKASERGEKRVHATQKPIALVEYCIEEYNSKSVLILDYFLGSGSTLIAAEKTKRKCYGMELDPKYCDVIVKRWEDFTGKKAHLEENEFEVITQAH